MRLASSGLALGPRVDSCHIGRTIVAMVINFTQHALARMVERGISRSEVLATMVHPMRTVEAQNGRNEAQGWIERTGKRQLLRVLYEGDTVVTVITVMVTSRFAKYGVQL